MQWLEARHRAHARVEDRIRCAKDTGLRRLPSREFAINAAWCTAAAIAADLIAWLQLLALDGDLAKAEPKRLRYRLLHTAARLTRGQRRRRLRIPSTWPWADQITAAFAPDRGDPRPRLTSSALSRRPEDPRRPRPPPRQTARHHAPTGSHRTPAITGAGPKRPTSAVN